MKSSTLLRVAVCSLLLWETLIFAPNEVRAARGVDPEIESLSFTERQKAAAGLYGDAFALGQQVSSINKTLDLSSTVGPLFEELASKSTLATGLLKKVISSGKILNSAISKVFDSMGGFGSGLNVTGVLSSIISENGTPGNLGGLEDAETKTCVMAADIVSSPAGEAQAEEAIPRARLLAKPIALATPIGGSSGTTVCTEENKVRCKEQQHQEKRKLVSNGEVGAPQEQKCSRVNDYYCK